MFQSVRIADKKNMQIITLRQQKLGKLKQVKNFA